MTYVAMALRNAIFTALYVVSYVTRITGTLTIDSHAELATNCLTDVARIHMHLLGLEIRSSDSEWYSVGMQIFAFKIDRHYWKKRELTWKMSQYNEPKVLRAKRVEEAMQAACAKWTAASPFTFRQLSSYDDEQPDINVRIPWKRDSLSRTVNMGSGNSDLLDDDGVTIEFLDSASYNDTSDENWCNLKAAALYELGHALGMADSNVPGAFMYRTRGNVIPALQSRDEPKLSKDDVDGINAKCNAKPPASSSSSSTSSSKSSSSSTSSSGERRRRWLTTELEPGYSRVTADGEVLVYRRKGGKSDFRLWGTHHL